MYSVVMMVALSTGGEMADLGHKKGGCGCSAPVATCAAPAATCAPVAAGCGHAKHGGLLKGHGHASGCGCGTAPVVGGCGAPVYTGGYAAPTAGCSTCGGGYASAAPVYSNPGMGYASAPVSSGCASCNSVSCAPMTFGVNEAVVLAPATITVTLPADAKLVINEIATTSTTATRTFISPELSSAKEYTYTLRAEIVREGKTVTMEKVVDVRGGQAVGVAFNDVREAVAAR